MKTTTLKPTTKQETTTSSKIGESASSTTAKTSEALEESIDEAENEESNELGFLTEITTKENSDKADQKAEIDEMLGELETSGEKPEISNVISEAKISENMTESLNGLPKTRGSIELIILFLLIYIGRNLSLN